MKRLLIALTLGCAVFGASPLFAEEAALAADEVVATEAVAEVAPEAAEAEPEAVLDKGDVAWMMISTVLVLLMVVPGLALFYGGMVRSKNMLSVYMQVLTVFSLMVVLWAVFGYSLAFVGEGTFYGGLEKAFLAGITMDTLSGSIPEYVFIAFQATFAGITGALIVGSFAERMKFSAVLLFTSLWLVLAYLPMAHMVWGGGFLAEKGDLDFAGGTVVHINAGVAGLVGAYFLGKRLGYGKEALRPHNLPFTLIGASLLWIGWFGFNAGSAVAADGVAGLALINTLFATAAAILGWLLVESIVKGKPSALGAASGAVAGLVGITPAAGFVGPMGSIAIGFAAGVLCVWGVTGLKKLLGADDSLDVFGVHGIGGIVGAILTGVFYAPSLGGVGPEDFDMAAQVGVQAIGVGVTLVWVGVASAIAYTITKLVVGLRVSEEDERVGLDLSSHSEKAYN